MRTPLCRRSARPSPGREALPCKDGRWIGAREVPLGTGPAAHRPRPASNSNPTSVRGPRPRPAQAPIRERRGGERKDAPSIGEAPSRRLPQSERDIRRARDPDPPPGPIRHLPGVVFRPTRQALLRPQSRPGPGIRVRSAPRARIPFRRGTAAPPAPRSIRPGRGLGRVRARCWSSLAASLIEPAAPQARIYEWPRIRFPDVSGAKVG